MPVTQQKLLKPVESEPVESSVAAIPAKLSGYFALDASSAAVREQLLENLTQALGMLSDLEVRGYISKSDSCVVFRSGSEKSETGKLFAPGSDLSAYIEVLKKAVLSYAQNVKPPEDLALTFKSIDFSLLNIVGLLEEIEVPNLGAEQSPSLLFRSVVDCSKQLNQELTKIYSWMTTTVAPPAPTMSMDNLFEKLIQRQAESHTPSSKEDRNATVFEALTTATTTDQKLTDTEQARLDLLSSGSIGQTAVGRSKKEARESFKVLASNDPNLHHCVAVTDVQVPISSDGRLASVEKAFEVMAQRGQGDYLKQLWIDVEQGLKDRGHLGVGESDLLYKLKSTTYCKVKVPFGRGVVGYDFYDAKGQKIEAKSSLQLSAFGTGIASVPRGAVELVVRVSAHHNIPVLPDQVLEKFREISPFVDSSVSSSMDSAIRLARKQVEAGRVDKATQMIAQAFKKQSLVYSTNSTLDRVHKFAGKNRLAFLNGLGVGSCFTLSFQLCSYLNRAGIPATVVSGAFKRKGEGVFLHDPGHCYVVVYTPHPIRLDSTTWIDEQQIFNVSKTSAAVRQRLVNLPDISEVEALELGSLVRRDTVEISQARAGSDIGHDIVDDLDTDDSLGSLKALEQENFYLCLAEALACDNDKRVEEVTYFVQNYPSYLAKYLSGRAHGDPLVEECEGASLFNAIVACLNDPDASDRVKGVLMSNIVTVCLNDFQGISYSPILEIFSKLCSEPKAELDSDYILIRLSDLLGSPKRLGKLIDHNVDGYVSAVRCFTSALASHLKQAELSEDRCKKFMETTVHAYYLLSDPCFTGEDQVEYQNVRKELVAVFVQLSSLISDSDFFNLVEEQLLITAVSVEGVSAPFFEFNDKRPVVFSLMTAAMRELAKPGICAAYLHSDGSFTSEFRSEVVNRVLEKVKAGEPVHAARLLDQVRKFGLDVDLSNYRETITQCFRGRGYTFWFNNLSIGYPDTSALNRFLYSYPSPIFCIREVAIKTISECNGLDLTDLEPQWSSVDQQKLAGETDRCLGKMSIAGEDLILHWSTSTSTSRIRTGFRRLVQHFSEAFPDLELDRETKVIFRLLDCYEKSDEGDAFVNIMSELEGECPEIYESLCTRAKEAMLGANVDFSGMALQALMESIPNYILKQRQLEVAIAAVNMRTMGASGHSEENLVARTLWRDLSIVLARFESPEHIFRDLEEKYRGTELEYLEGHEIAALLIGFSKRELRGTALRDCTLFGPTAHTVDKLYRTEIDNTNHQATAWNRVLATHRSKHRNTLSADLIHSQLTAAKVSLNAARYRSLASQLSSVNSRVFIGGARPGVHKTDEFIDHVEYAPGMDPRQINVWQQIRTGQLFVKRFGLAPKPKKTEAFALHLDAEMLASAEKSPNSHIREAFAFVRAALHEKKQVAVHVHFRGHLLWSLQHDDLRQDFNTKYGEHFGFGLFEELWRTGFDVYKYKEERESSFTYPTKALFTVVPDVEAHKPMSGHNSREESSPTHVFLCSDKVLAMTLQANPSIKFEDCKQIKV